MVSEEFLIQYLPVIEEQLILINDNFKILYTLLGIMFGVILTYLVINMMFKES